METKKKLQRFLSIFLACVMLLNAPMSALAFEDIQLDVIAEDVETIVGEDVISADETIAEEADVISEEIISQDQEELLNEENAEAEADAGSLSEGVPEESAASVGDEASEPVQEDVPAGEIVIEEILELDAYEAALLEEEMSTDEGPVTATVSFTSQEKGEFQIPPQFDMKVSSDTAETYGYTDQTSQATQVSAIDVLVAAHAVKYGDSFTKDSAREFLIADGNFVTRMFGSDNGGNVCILVNGQQPGSHGVEQAVVEDGDLIEFFVYQNAAYLDKYVWLALPDGTKADGQTVYGGEEAEIVVKGFSPFTYGYEGDEGETVISGATVYVVDIATGTLTSLNVTTGEDGTASITVPEAYIGKTVYLTAKGTEMAMTLSKIKVEAAPVSTVCNLSSLEIAVGGNTIEAATVQTLTPAFEGATIEYATPVLDYVSDKNSRFVWVKVSAPEGTTVTAKCGESNIATLVSGEWAVLQEQGGYFWNPTYSGCLNTGVYNKVIITVSKEGESDKVYTVTVPMQPDISNRSLAWKTDLANAIYFTKDAENASLTVEAQYKNRPLENTDEITYQWYSNTTASNEDGAAIEGATAASYNPKVTEPGDSYYYVVASCAGLESVTSNTITVTVTEDAAPQSITVVCDHPYTIPDTWVNALGGVKYIAKAGDTLNLKAVDENGNETPVVWPSSLGGGTLDRTMGSSCAYTITNTSYSYIKAASLYDSSIQSEEKVIQVADYAISTYNKTPSVTLSADGQSAKEISTQGGLNGYNIWSYTLSADNVASLISGVNEKSNCIKFSAVRPGTIDVSFDLDLNGDGNADGNGQTDSATLTINGIAVEDADGELTKTYLEISEKAPAPTVQLKALSSTENASFTWSTADETVATVDENGLVTAKGVGSVIISANDGTYTGGIKVVVSSAETPYFEQIDFETTSAWSNGLSSSSWETANFKPTTLAYTGLTMTKAAAGTLTLKNTTLYNTEKYSAVATYTDVNGEQQSVSINSGAATAFSNIPFETNTITITLTDKTDETKKTVYTFEVTRPRDTTMTIANNGIVFVPDGRQIWKDKYSEKTEGIMYVANEDGSFAQYQGVSSSRLYYRTYAMNALEAFTLTLKGGSAYTHIRYSTDDGATWKYLGTTGTGGVSTDKITFPVETNEENQTTETEGTNPVVKVMIQILDDSTYAANAAAEKDGFADSKPNTYTVWVEQIPVLSAECDMVTAVTDTGDWYPTFDTSRTSYRILVAPKGEAPVLTFTVSENAKVTIGEEVQTPNENGEYTLTLTEKAQDIVVAASDGMTNKTYSFGYSERESIYVPDKVVDFLSVNSQYTNGNGGGYGTNPQQTLTGGLLSLGNFGGYVTFYLENGLTDNPNNAYGVDFYVNGNAFKDTSTGTGLGSMEPGQVWVSEDGSTWYALAGSEHYEPSTIWNYSVTYKKTKTGGTSWTDNYGNTDASTHGRSFAWPSPDIYTMNNLAKQNSFTLSGILLPCADGTITGTDSFNSFSKGGRFGYVDMLVNGTENPYLDNSNYSNESSGFDLAWAVDAAGNPVDVSGMSFHYVKVVTASNIIAGSANEKSTEVSNLVVASPTGSAVGVTAAPSGVTFISGEETHAFHFEEGKEIYEVSIPEGMTAASIRVDGTSEADNIYINNQRVSSGKASDSFAFGADSQKLVRIIVQNGAQEPVIYLLKVKADAVSDTRVTLNKNALSLVVENSTKLTAAVDASLGNVEVTWSTSDENIVTVNENGAITGVSVGTAVITATAGTAKAECVVTVNPIPRLSDLQIYLSANDYKNGEEALVLTPKFDNTGQTYSGYSVEAPDYLSSLYTVATVSQETLDTGYSDYLFFSNQWGGWSGSALVDGVSARDANFSKGYVEVYFGTDSKHTYQVNVSQYATLKALTIDGVVNSDFDRALTTYHAYVDSTAKGVEITPAAYKSAYTVTVNGTAVTNGEAYTLPYNWDDSGKMLVHIVVSGEGIESSTYTVELEKKPLNDAPFIMTQPVEADYTVIDPKSSVKALTVEASANGELAYQWYYNTADSNENGTEIDGAQTASYTPPVTEDVIGTRYYYCVVTNTGKNENNVTASKTARITVDPDPTPVAVLGNTGTAMPEDGYAYAWDTGHLYTVGQEAEALTVTATSEAEGGTMSYQWYSVARPYNINGWSSVFGRDTTSVTFIPPTDLSLANDTGKYYGCKVTYTFKGKTYTSWATTGETYTEGEGETAKTHDVMGIYIFIKVDSAAAPEITSQPASADYIVGDAAANLTISANRADSGKLTYQWYVNDTDSTEGAHAIEGATSAYYRLGTVTEAGTKYYYCTVTNTIQGYTSSTTSEIGKVTAVTAESLIGDKLTGSGTAEDPYRISDAQDYQDVYDLVAQGVSFEGMYLKQMNDITLPDNWIPVGILKNASLGHINSGKNVWFFSGNLDGNGKTVTVPEGGRPLLGYVKGASVSNLNIYGKKINGYGLVNHLEGVGLSGTAITIDNVTLKSGSSTLKSGLIGTYLTNNGFAGCSAGFGVAIRNCTIEQGVVIGYKKDQSQIGSIAGRINGTIENCISYATVYGKNYAGGILGTRDNAMGTCNVTNCTFGGAVEATGEHAGGIAGGGYQNSTAPNGAKINILNCTSTGNISGSNKVGGIIGGDTYVAQLWGAHALKNNTFTGKVSASDGTYVGGIIGFYGSLNKYDDIANNYYSADCGAARGIGFAQYIDTNCETHETELGATYFNTETSTEGCPSVTGCAWKKAHNRTDDPLGANADKLATSNQDREPYVVELTVSGDYKTEYYMGQEFDFTGMSFTAQWSTGAATNPKAEDVTVSDFDTAKQGYQTVKLSYGDASTTISVKLLRSFKVTFSLLGDQLHESDKDGKVHTLASANLTTWVPETVYYVDPDSTVYDVMKEAADEYGFAIVADDGTQYGTYVEAITMNNVTLAEFDNGPRSGWMYTVNGVHPEVGVAAKYVDNGDVIVFHYSDDYTVEESLMWDKEQVGNVTDAVAALPALDKLTAADADAVKAAREAYESLTDTQKAQVSAETLKQLEAAEAKIAELQKAEEEAQKPHVHSWDAGTVTKTATCKETGVKTFKCTCGQTKTETIAKNTAHKYGSWTTVSEATVKAAEVQKHTCTICGKEETQTVGEALTPILEVPGKLKSFNIKKGRTAKFTVLMANGDSVSSVKSSKTKYLKASVDKKTGKITLKGVKKGTSKLTIKLASGKERTYTIKVVTGTVKTSSVSVTSVKNKKLTLAVKKTHTLKSERKPFTSTQKLTYKSSNKKVATVSSKGKIKAVAPGKAAITVSSGSRKVKITVTVPGITNVKSSVSVKRNKTLTLKPKTYGISEKVTYTSSNTKIATVTSKGKIKGIRKGTAKITIKAGTFKKTVKVKVK